MERLYRGSLGGSIVEATTRATIKGKTKEKQMINLTEGSLQRAQK